MNEGCAPVGGGSVAESKKARLVQWHSGGAAAAVCSSRNPNLSAADFGLRLLRSPAAETCDAHVGKPVRDLAFGSFTCVRQITLPGCALA